MLQSGASFHRILSVASDAPVRGTELTPGRSSLGASAVLHSAPDAPILGVFLSYSLCCPRCSSLWHRVHPLTIRGQVPCFIPPPMLQSGASFCRILSAALDAPVLGTGFTPGRSSPGASAVLHSAPDAPIWGVFLSYSLRCPRRSGLWHRVHPRTIWGLVPCFIPPPMPQSGASFCRILSAVLDAPVRGTGFTPGRSSPGASAVLHSAPDAPIRGVLLS